MILYSPAKLNIGLYILRKRDDGFHDILSLMYPFPLYDIIEISIGSNKENPFAFSQSGIIIPGKLEENLCYKAWDTFNKKSSCNPIKTHIHKQIPHGAGLGGGSSNAATILTGLNFFQNQKLTKSELIQMAAKLGSDCPFFIESKPAITEGRGEILTETNTQLKNFHLVLLNPGININTAWAYSHVTTDDSREDIRNILSQPIERWKDLLINDFEECVFNAHPEVSHLKNTLYSEGAIYASMSGSGSSVYGIFREKPVLPEDLKKYLVWEGKL